MNIVFDTNVIFGDWYLNGPNMVLIETFLKSHKLTLFIPEIVIQETKNRYRKEMESLLLTWNKIMILNPDLSKTFPILKLEDLCREYNDKLEQRLSELNIIRPNYDDIPHSQIVARSLLNKKPFRESDNGIEIHYYGKLY